ncbi:MAG: hypothetical protein ACQESP_08555 [Candidatus Muiribacteriota bacterium]
MKIKRTILFFFLFSILINGINSENVLFLREVPLDHYSYEVLNYFILNKDIIDAKEYKKHEQLSRYRITLYLNSIILSLEDENTYIHNEEIVNSIENLISDFSYEIEFIFGDIFESYEEIISNYRIRAGYIKRENVSQKPREKILYPFERPSLTEGESDIYFSYSYGYSHEMSYISKNRKFDNSGHINFMLDFSLNNYTLNNKMLRNNETLIIDHELLTPDRLTEVKYSYLHFFENEALSFSKLQINREDSFKIGHYSFKLNSSRHKIMNSSGNNFFSAGHKKKSFELTINDTESFFQDTELVLRRSDFSNQETDDYGNSETSYGFRFRKKLTYDFLLDSVLNLNYFQTNINNKDELRKDGTFNNFYLSFFYPLKNFNSINLSYRRINRKLSLKDNNFFNATHNFTSIYKNFFNFNQTDMSFGLHFEAYDAHQHAASTIEIDNHDYKKRYASFDFTHYFSYDFSLDISLKYGYKKFDDNISGFENFKFVSRTLDFRFWDYLFEYSVYDRKHSEFSNKNSKVLSLGVFYAYFW